MSSRFFHMDAQNRAQDLAASILAADSRPQISSALSAADSFLRRHASDQCRPFFSLAFPSLLCRLFGFDSSSPSSSSWLDLAASDPDLSSRLFSLLSPSGVLLSSISAVDRHGLVKYVFPRERLPEWMRFALQTGHVDISPLFAGRVKEDNIQGSYQLQLGVFEYYIFWFAYYPVSRGDSEGPESGVIRKKRRFRLENWTSSLPVLSATGRQPGQKPQCSLYLRLLYAYLQAFVPKGGGLLQSCQPYRSSLLHYSGSGDGAAFFQAEFLVHTFVHFWMVDNDFSPLPVAFCRSFGVSFPFKAVFGEIPPTPGLGDMVKLLVMYLNCNKNSPDEVNEQKMFTKSPVMKDIVRSRAAMFSCENSVGSWNSVIQRPLYRYILRTFLFCPMGASFKNAAQVFSVWIMYMAPWKTSKEDFVEFDAPPGVQNQENKDTGMEGCQIESVYTLAWQSYVLSNYLFYSSLVVHFLGFAHKFLHTNVESVIQMVSKVLNVLTSSSELLDHLHRVDAAYHSKPPGPSSYSSDDVHKYIPSIREQLQDWEDGLCESDADGSFLHEHWNCDLRLFSDGEDGAHNLLQLLLLRAEHEVQLLSGDVSQNLRILDLIRSQMKRIFGGHIQKSHSIVSSDKAHDQHHGRSEVFTPKHPGVGRIKWHDVRYKGDWMRRPISDTEVAWLARILIRLSDWLNEVLGLDRVDDTVSAGPTYVDVGRDEVSTVGGPKEAFCMVLALIRSWLLLLGNAMLRFMRAHKMKVNLRVLASKKIVVALVLYSVFAAFWKVFSRAFAISGPV
ncbi:uncharacterized protein [Typha latifolia]|uniref:uncharacterized protein n=1 Tax=Typha latifolia TaxID=4733 RepID=UPI003C30DD43